MRDFESRLSRLETRLPSETPSNIVPPCHPVVSFDLLFFRHVRRNAVEESTGDYSVVPKPELREAGIRDRQAVMKQLDAEGLMAVDLDDEQVARAGEIIRVAEASILAEYGLELGYELCRGT